LGIVVTTSYSIKIQRTELFLNTEYIQSFYRGLRKIQFVLSPSSVILFLVVDPEKPEEERKGLSPILSPTAIYTNYLYKYFDLGRASVYIANKVI
jgi:hypothetical protein